ncbi:MAG: hypothetical protein ACOC3G_05435 [Phycisphaeraceae bacterium]
MLLPARPLHLGAQADGGGAFEGMVRSLGDPRPLGRGFVPARFATVLGEEDVAELLEQEGLLVFGDVGRFHGVKSSALGCQASRPGRSS